jgi:hypothetical protein
LKAEWERVFGRPPPLYLRRTIFLLAIDYRRQEQAHGGLRPETVRQLVKAAAEAVPGEKAKPAMAPAYRPGTIVAREWRGKTHTVTVLAQGFAYEGKAYRSLSEIARIITGTRWSGPAFFGLRGKQIGIGRSS